MATGEKKIFDEIWEEREHKSFISGKTLPYSINNFAHVIPKKGNNRLTFESTAQRNELLRLNKDNIVILTPEEHHLYDFGTKDKRKEYAEYMAERGVIVDWERLYNLKEELICSLSKLL